MYFLTNGKCLCTCQEEMTSALVPLSWEKKIFKRLSHFRVGQNQLVIGVSVVWWTNQTENKTLFSVRKYLLQRWTTVGQSQQILKFHGSQKIWRWWVLRQIISIGWVFAYRLYSGEIQSVIIEKSPIVQVLHGMVQNINYCVRAGHTVFGQNLFSTLIYKEKSLKRIFFQLKYTYDEYYRPLLEF